MYASPYQLDLQTENPTQFYDELAFYSQTVVKSGFSNLENYIHEFARFVFAKNIKSYSNEEYLIELLMAGTFWNNYHKQFTIDAIFYAPVFNKLYAWRTKYPKRKLVLDNYRAKLAYRLLSVEKNKEIKIYQRFEYLNSWLNATKEFKQEVERLNYWQAFLESKNIAYQKKFWQEVEAFATWFEKDSQTNLGKYTIGWNDFMMDTADNYKNKENYFFCTRKPNEYHLNMVAAEVMNKALQPAYNKASQKILLLPTCMAKSTYCQAKLEGKHLKCNHCTTNCNVSNLTKQMNKKGIETVLIPHSSSFSEYLKTWEDSKNTALIGVACTLNLITGGYEMQKLNIPSQCVFLNSCGCKKHWLSGKPTNLNEVQLNKLTINKETIPEVHITARA